MVKLKLTRTLSIQSMATKDEQSLNALSLCDITFFKQSFCV